jgi:5-formyltetrahydrofolate cyclo-ligase
MSDRNESRQNVWNKLRAVARPDSRFHFDFSEFITDFEGSDKATDRLTAMEIYRDARVVFITPDNCLELLRTQVIRDQKVLLMTTYGIRRGFIELLPNDVPAGLEEWAILLDVIERLGRYISLAELQQRYPQIDLLVTGGSAVTYQGARFGKGHGFFDIEWATLYSMGVVDVSTPIVDFVHDCQLVDEELELSAFDTICDYIVTPTQVLHVPSPQKPTGGIYWDRLAPGMMENISILKELQALEQAGKLRPEVMGKEVKSQ